MKRRREQVVAEGLHLVMWLFVLFHVLDIFPIVANYNREEIPSSMICYPAASAFLAAFDNEKSQG